jgi:hypothetical protein
MVEGNEQERSVRHNTSTLLTALIAHPHITRRGRLSFIAETEKQIELCSKLPESRGLQG